MGARDGSRNGPGLSAPPSADVVVAGAGPAGRAVARACARRGLAVVLVDPRPDRPWRHTYGAWHHELPLGAPGSGVDTLTGGVVAASGVGWAVAGRTHRLDDPYAVLDTAHLQAELTDESVATVRGRVAEVLPATTGSGREAFAAVLSDGRRVLTALVVDATGAAQALASPAPRSSSRPRAAEQTAFGVVVDTPTADAVTGGRLLFMDWRPRHGRPGWPTFLYAIPLGGGRWLLEETSLARRPGLPFDDLRDRLERRLRAAGVAAVSSGPARPDPARVEHVRFPVDTPRHRSPAGVVAVGAAVPLVHPATGFSVARSLAVAPRLADAVVGTLGGTTGRITIARPEHRAGMDASGRAVVEAARRAVSGPQARVVHAMRHRGLDVLLRMPPGEVPAFFDHFFALPAPRRRAYLEASDDVGASLGAMLALFGALPPRLRARLVLGSVAGPGAGQRG